MKLGLKLLLAPMLVAAVSISAGGIYGVVDYQERQRFNAGYAADSASLNVAASTQEGLAQMRAEVYRTLALLASLDDAAVKAARADLGQRAQTIQAAIGGLVKAGEPDSALQGIVSRVDKQLGDYLARCQKAIDLSAVDANMGVGAMRSAEEVYRANSKDLQALVARIEAQQRERSTASDQRQLRLLGVLAAALLLAGAAAAAAAWNLRCRVVRQLNEAVRLCEATAEGNLVQASTNAGSAGDDEIGDLQRALSRMVGSLNESLATVRAATDHIGTASREIASGNLDLSQRTEQAASSLQQTASSMTQLTATVKQTADSARTANQLASSASSVAQRGGEAVSQVVSTMDEINTSSRKIAEIISTIDGIAFQTNILALNAAVEAARAGEQGRGFAVVASEVRSLAQRSAEAAKQIKTLIQASVEKVESGSRQVQDAGSTMAEIVGSVRRVSDIIGEISAAAAEQSSGIGQVNGAVSNLDQVTQQNAALVEQSAAAAESLKEQAAKLGAVVSRFQLGAAASAA